MGYDWILYVIVAAFLGWEGTSHYALHNQSGHTLSNRVKWLEHRGPGWAQLAVRALVAAACVALGVHLEGAF